MITHRFIGVRPIGHSAGVGGLRLPPGMSSRARHGEAAHPLAEESSVPRVDGSAWDRRRLACCLVGLPVIALVTYLYVQGAASFYRTFSQHTSLGSEWDALASVNRSIPSSPFNDSLR